MDFSETYRFSGPVPVCSPCGKYIAAATEYRLVVRDALTTQVAQIYSCIDKISDVQWCPSSTYIMCGLVKRAIVQVWSVVEPDWTCKIDEGLAGAEAVQWSPDGLHILVTADFQIRITIWSLASKSFVYISGPKHATRGIKVSPDGEYMAVAEEARILNHATWSPLAVLGHPGNITSPEDAVVYKEVADISNAASQVPTKAAKSHYIVCQLPVKVTQQKVPLDKPNVRLGVD
ncbi:MAG: WD repeat-containing WRAP73 isoform X1 [Trebouxia sp. A1-2]|nr:MAG: WD repeat-containing WRAP73 isoform X1 [Trebouxia sp. A1-2]